MYTTRSMLHCLYYFPGMLRYHTGHGVTQQGISDLRHWMTHELEHDLPQRADAAFVLQLSDPRSHLACSAIPENLQPHVLHMIICVDNMRHAASFSLLLV